MRRKCSQKYWEKHKKSVRHKINIENYCAQQSTHLIESTSKSERVRNQNDERLYDNCKICVSKSNKSHVCIKTLKNKEVETHEKFLSVLPSKLYFKTRLKSAEPQFKKAKVSIITKNTRTHFNASIFIDLLREVSKT